MALDIRQNEILAYLKKKKHASIHELSAELHASDSTIRRDLTEMEKLGLLERNHGGAVFLESADEVSIFVRVEKDAYEKEMTASLAVNKLPHFRSIFIDNSSTCMALAQRMDFRHRTVVTNGLMLAMELSKREDINLLVIGGRLHYHTNSLTGVYAARYLDEMHFDLAIASCTFVALDGSFESSAEQGEVKRAAFAHSDMKILLADRTKFDKHSLYRTIPLADYDVVYSNVNDQTALPYRNAGINLINK